MHIANRNSISVIILSILLCSVVSVSATSNVSAPLGWGFEVGRADETDVEALIADQIAIRMTLGRMSRIGKDALGRERMVALLGGSARSEENQRELSIRFEEWWEEHIDKRATRILTNPAASCQEAQEILRLILGHERQLALTSGWEARTSWDLYSLSQTRCQEEALDECNSTGRYDHLPRMYAEEDRVAALVSSSVDEKWVLDVLEECAIYELHYVSTTNISDAFKLNSVIDGRIKLKHKVDYGKGLKNPESISFEGEVMSGANPLLQKITCSAPNVSITCSPGGEPKKSAWAKVSKMTLRSKEFYVENEQSKQRPVGEDLLELIFSPAMLSSVAVVRVPQVPPQTIPFVEVGATGFYIAHKKSETEALKFKFTETKRAGYPTIFEFTRAGSDSVGVAASDSTVFRLIHKPQKKPFPSKAATPKREPLKPKAPTSPRTTRP